MEKHDTNGVEILDDNEMQQKLSDRFSKIANYQVYPYEGPDADAIVVVDDSCFPDGGNGPMIDNEGIRWHSQIISLKGHAFMEIELIQEDTTNEKKELYLNVFCPNAYDKIPSFRRWVDLLMNVKGRKVNLFLMGKYNYGLRNMGKAFDISKVDPRLFRNKITVITSLDMLYMTFGNMQISYRPNLIFNAAKEGCKYCEKLGDV